EMAGCGGMIGGYPWVDWGAADRTGHARARRDSAVIAAETARGERFENALVHHLRSQFERLQAATGRLEDLAAEVAADRAAAEEAPTVRGPQAPLDLIPLFRGLMKGWEHASYGVS